MIEIRSMSDLGGECFRCHRPAHRVFFMCEGDPGWALTDKDLDRLTAPPELQAVCEPCLTDEEVARYLQPVASFVLNELYKTHPHIRELAHAGAFLQFRLGFEYDQRAVARRALLGLAGAGSMK